MLRLACLICLIISLSSCRIFKFSADGTLDKTPIPVGFCDLQNYNGQLVKVKVQYFGLMEYWGASGFENCTLNNKVELNFEEIGESRLSFLKTLGLRRLHKKQEKKKGILTVVGEFETGRVDSIASVNGSWFVDSGYGHLGSNDAQILVKSFRMRLVNKSREF